MPGIAPFSRYIWYIQYFRGWLSSHLQVVFFSLYWHTHIYMYVIYIFIARLLATVGIENWVFWILVFGWFLAGYELKIYKNTASTSAISTNLGKKIQESLSTNTIAGNHTYLAITSHPRILETATATGL
jgi:hypothetical protein